MAQPETSRATLEKKPSAQAARSQKRSAVSSREEYLALLNEMTHAILLADNFDATLNALAIEMARLIGADDCYITRWDEERRLTIPTVTTASLPFQYSLDAEKNPEVNSLTASVLRAEHALAVEDVFNSPHISAEIAKRYPARSALGVPLMARGQKLGAALIAFNSPCIMQFHQPDTLIPEPYNPQSYNRYSYGLNNPSRYTDPSGHVPACDRDDWACQTHWDEPIAIEQLNKKYSKQLTEEQAEAWDFVIGASEIVVSVLYEPVDWALTCDDYERNGFNPWMLAGILPGIPSSLTRRLDDVPWRSIVDERYWKTIEGAFKNDPVVYQLTGELDVFRRYSGDLKVSPWFSPKPYVYPGNARRYLALPNKNLATNIAEFVIPKDTKLLFGKTASQILDTFFGSHAAGGGLQIYLPNPFVAKRTK